MAAAVLGILPAVVCGAPALTGTAAAPAKLPAAITATANVFPGMPAPTMTGTLVMPPAATGTAPAPTASAATTGTGPVVVTPPDQPAKPSVQIAGRLIHTWYEKPGLRVLVVIDGFVVQSRQEQVSARDGVIWFDEEAARRTGRMVLGVFAETGVEYRRVGGQVDKYDSFYVTIESPGELSVQSQEPQRGSAENTELYLRAKKMRQEYLSGGVRETPTSIVPPPVLAALPSAPGVKEAGVPEEITIVAQDDVRKVNFTSVVEDGIRISTWTGGVYVIYSSTDSAGVPVSIELAADNIVLWVPEEQTRPASGAGTPDKTAPAATSTVTAQPPSKGAATPSSGDKYVTATIGIPAEGNPTATEPKIPATTRAGGKVVAVEGYLEGHVRLNRGGTMLVASQMYYDFSRDRALAIDTKIHTFAQNRNVPVFYYAKEVRQVARGVFVGTDARLTTSSFLVPQYDLRASRMTIQELTPEAQSDGENVQYRRLRFLGEDVQFEIRQTPITWWPRMSGDVTESDTALRSIRFEHRSNRGLGVATQWHLLKLLGAEQRPQDLDLYLDADYWQKRGPALGVEGKYDRPEYFGRLNTYFLANDTGTDRFAGSDIEPPSPQRGRISWQHRAFLPENWTLTLEGSYISDATFMNEFFPREDRQGKAQETLAYLKKQELDQALWILVSARVNDFYTRTSYFPQVGYDVIGHSLWNDRLTYFQDTEAAIAQYQPFKPGKPFDPFGTGQQGLVPANAALESPVSFILDSIHELDMPLKLGVFNVVPFVEARVSYFSNTPDGGGKFRLEGKEGVRLSTQSWKVYNDVESEFWDLHRMRHVNIFDMTAYASQVSAHSSDLYPFAPTGYGTQEVVGVDGQGVLQLGWRQRFQTKRGLPDADGKQANIDWLTTDLEATLYGNRCDPRIGPDTGPEFNNIDFRAHWRATDTTSLWTELLFNMDDSRVERFDIGALFTQSPRLSYTVGQRYIASGSDRDLFGSILGPAQASSITFAGLDYVINEKWRVSLLEQYDWSRKKFAHHDLVFTRRMERWLMRIKVSYEPGGMGSFFGFEFQPIGVHEVRFGW
jgi:hypothetical protein